MLDTHHCQVSRLCTLLSCIEFDLKMGQKSTDMSKLQACNKLAEVVQGKEIWMDY